VEMQGREAETEDVGAAPRPFFVTFCYF